MMGGERWAEEEIEGERGYNRRAGWRVEKWRVLEITAL